MTTRRLAITSSVLLVAVSLHCCKRPTLPDGPRPVYERPRVIPWDSGVRPGVDPLDAVIEEALIDEPAALQSPTPGGAGATAGEGDAGSLPRDAGVR